MQSVVVLVYIYIYIHKCVRVPIYSKNRVEIYTLSNAFRVPRKRVVTPFNHLTNMGIPVMLTSEYTL